MNAKDRATQNMEKNLQRLGMLRPIDDDFMRCMFKDDIELVQFVLRIILEKPDLLIESSETQKDMKRLVGARSISLDVHGVDSEGKQYDIEIQRADYGANPHRARYHSSVMDVESLDAGQDFSELPETYTIFITEADFFGEDEPFYLVERVITTINRRFEDGAHILYVNGKYRGDSDIGKLMHDFNCSSADDMHFPLMAKRTRYLKESKEGVSEMCRVIEEMRAEERAEGRAEGRTEGIAEGILFAIKNLMANAGMPVEQAMAALGIPEEERSGYVEMMER